MSKTNRDLCREAIQGTLAHRVGGPPDASAVAEAILSIWRKVVAQLEPVIGGRGVDVIFERSLQMASAAFPWLAIAGAHEGSAALLASLKVRLEGREPNDAAEAGYTLLVAFTELLATMIGESLTVRLLEPVWVSTSPASKKETKS